MGGTLMKKQIIYSYGKRYSRINIMKEMIPVALISLLFSFLVYGLVDLKLEVGILLFALLFVILCYCLLPGAFDVYWSIDQDGISYMDISKKDSRKMLLSTLLKNQGVAETHIDKTEINKMKLVYKKNTITGPAKRRPDTFFALIYSNGEKRKINLTHVPDQKASEVIKVLQTFCDNIEDEDHILYAIDHDLNLYDYLYRMNQ